MTRTILIAIAVAFLGLGTAACGKKGDPRLVSGGDDHPRGYPAGAESVKDNIFRKPGPE